MFNSLYRQVCIMLVCMIFCINAYALTDPDSLRNSITKSCLGKEVDKEKCLITGQDFTIIKSLSSNYHYLFVPVTSITGIESPQFWTAGYPAWFQTAWRYRHIAAPWLGKGVNPEKVGIAINSQFRRTQNQLHIHLNCVRQDVLDELNAAPISDSWTELNLKSLNGHVFRAIRLQGSDIPDDLLTKLYQSSAGNMNPASVTLFAALSSRGQATVVEGVYDAENPSTGFAEEFLTACR